MRKQVVNTWGEGLVNDFNPINTPNTVLTDCVNGTIITYDGNEQSLQNDMGNYLLEHAKLPTNYIPVGTTSYGDILYIVAHNPITGKTQIGSFPSPKRRVDATVDLTSDVDFPSILRSATTEDLLDGGAENEFDYHKLMDNHSKLFVFYDNEKGNLDIYPGDELYLEPTNGDDDHFDYEYLDFYIVDKNNNVQKLNNSDLEIKTNGEYRCVSWTVPGNLAMKWSLPSITSFEVRPKFIVKIKETSGTTEDSVDVATEANVTLTMQVGSSDVEVNNAFKDSNLGVIIKGGEGDSTFVHNTTDENPSGFETTHGATDVYESTTYNNIVYRAKFPIKDDHITASIRPVIKTIAGPNGEFKPAYIVYDDFPVDLNVSDLSNAEIAIANTQYKYSINKNVATIVYNISAPIVSAMENEQYFKVEYAAVNDIAKAKCFVDAYPSWIDAGENDYAYGSNKLTIAFPREEDLYVLKFTLTVDNDTKIVYKLLICSESMNKFSEIENFDTISFTDWANAVMDFDTNITYNNVVLNNTNEKYVYNTGDSAYLSIAKGSSAFKPQSYVSEDNILRRGYYYNASVNILPITTQKYLYNFGNIEYSAGSSASCQNATTTLRNSESKTLSNIKVPCYAEVAFKARNTEIFEYFNADFKNVYDYTKEKCGSDKCGLLFTVTSRDNAGIFSESVRLRLRAYYYDGNTVIDCGNSEYVSGSDANNKIYRENNKTGYNCWNIPENENTYAKAIQKIFNEKKVSILPCAIYMDVEDSLKDKHGSLWVTGAIEDRLASTKLVRKDSKVHYGWVMRDASGNPVFISNGTNYLPNSLENSQLNRKDKKDEMLSNAQMLQLFNKMPTLWNYMKQWDCIFKEPTIETGYLLSKTISSSPKSKIEFNIECKMVASNISNNNIALDTLGKIGLLTSGITPTLSKTTKIEVNVPDSSLPSWGETAWPLRSNIYDIDNVNEMGIKEIQQLYNEIESKATTNPRSLNDLNRRLDKNLPALGFYWNTGVDYQNDNDFNTWMFAGNNIDTIYYKVDTSIPTKIQKITADLESGKTPEQIPEFTNDYNKFGSGYLYMYKEVFPKKDLISIFVARDDGKLVHSADNYPYRHLIYNPKHIK